MSKQTYPLSQHSPAPSLAEALFLLAATPVTSRTVDIPPPLPEHEWVGKPHLNYTQLHQEFVDVLICLYIPVGVLGLYMWLSSVLMVVSSLYQAIRNKEKQGNASICGNIFGILTSIASIFVLYQNAQTVHDCSQATRFDAVRWATFLALIGSGFSVAGGILIIIAAYSTSVYVANIAVVLFSVALGLQYVSGPVYFGSVVISAGISQVSAQWDRVNQGAITVALLPGAVFQVVLGIVTWNSKATDKLRLKGQRRYVVFVLGQVVSLAFLFSAMGNVILGKIVGDPWGQYTLQKLVGVATVMFTSVVPLLDGLLVFFTEFDFSNRWWKWRVRAEEIEQRV